ncbi:MAG: ABC transporter ATP-binding protein [Lachnospiraceae bacterium]|nr:ABC transporter ATP-binding protein [Lachnospiraceae bacterium]
MGKTNKQIDFLNSVKLVKKYDKGILKLMFLRSVVNCVGIYFNSVSLGLIIDALGKREKKEVLYLVVGIGLFNALLAVARLVLNKVINMRNFYLQQHYNKSKTAACFAVDYAETETVEFQDMRQNIRYSDDNMGTFPALLNVFERFYESCMTLVIGIGIMITMLFSVKTSSPVAVAAFIAAFAVLVVFAGCFTKIVKKLQKVSSGKVPVLFDDMAKGNRLGMYLLERIVHNYNMGKDIRIYHTEKLVNTEFGNMVDRMADCYKKICLFMSAPSTGSDIVYVILGGMIYIVMAFAALLGHITVGSVVIYADSIRKVLGTWSDIFICYGEFGVLQNRLGSVKELLSMAEEAKECMETKECQKVWSPMEITFENVSFRYPNEEEWALDNVSFTIKKGEKICIVGKNGAGKSTAIKLLCGLYQPQKGRILVEGIDLRKIPGEAYRKMLSVVFQDFKLFSFSISDNLSMGNEFDEERARKIFRELGMEKRVANLENGMNTVLYHDYEDGIECSGGEAQKIALARSHYQDTPVLILDEPTSALDARTEMEIFRDMDRISNGKTVLYVSHRLSSCRFSDRVIVFDDGRIVQNGTHEALVAEENSVYQKLWNAQAQYYT